MNAYASPGQNFSRYVDEIMDTVSAEVREAAAYVNAVVVPQVRRESSAALRQLAGHLERLAEKIHHDEHAGQPRA